MQDAILKITEIMLEEQNQVIAITGLLTTGICTILYNLYDIIF